MFRKGTAAVGAALILGSSSVASDASTGNKAGYKKLAVNGDGKKSAKSKSLPTPTEGTSPRADPTRASSTSETCLKRPGRWRMNSRTPNHCVHPRNFIASR